MSTQVTPHFINGEYTSGTGDKIFLNRRPIDNSIISKVGEATQTDVDAAVSAAQKAVSGPWSQISLQEKTEILYAIAAGIEERFDKFLDAEVADTGKPVDLASRIDIPRGAANFCTFADVVKNVSGEYFDTSTPDGTGAINYSLRVPKGVIAVICPWNLPLLLMTWKVAPALACGNTVVVKPSEETPSTATLLGEVMNSAGVPKGVYNVVHGFGPGSTGELLVRHPGIDAVTFTGETVTGEAIMKNAAKGVRDVSFELGGKNPALVFADCDLESTIEGLGRACFANTGQVCLGTERVYVERPIFEDFVNALKVRAESLRMGDPHESTTTLGPLISIEHRDKVLTFYEQAKRDGATIVTGGGIPAMSRAYSEGAWVQPTIWTGLPESSRVLREEIFGPCCHVRPFDSEEEAINLANDTPYGLATCIWTKDGARAHRVAQRVHVGITWINCWFLRDLRTPFGGAKQSGIGREGGVHSLEFYSELRNVCLKL